MAEKEEAGRDTEVVSFKTFFKENNLIINTMLAAVGLLAFTSSLSSRFLMVGFSLPVMGLIFLFARSLWKEFPPAATAEKEVNWLRYVILSAVAAGIYFFFFKNYDLVRGAWPEPLILGTALAVPWWFVPHALLGERQKERVKNWLTTGRMKLAKLSLLFGLEILSAVVMILMVVRFSPVFDAIARLTRAS